jgi:hypothetical protein
VHLAQLIPGVAGDLHSVALSEVVSRLLQFGAGLDDVTATAKQSRTVDAAVVQQRPAEQRRQPLHPALEGAGPLLCPRQLGRLLLAGADGGAVQHARHPRRGSPPGHPQHRVVHPLQALVEPPVEHQRPCREQEAERLQVDLSTGPAHTGGTLGRRPGIAEAPLTDALVRLRDRQPAGRDVGTRLVGHVGQPRHPPAGLGELGPVDVLREQPERCRGRGDHVSGSCPQLVGALQS